MSAEESDAAVEDLLEYLRDARNLDFTGYKRPSLTRRIRKRMDALGVSSFDEYRDFLEVNPNEHSPLVDTILINVTGFFRDEEAWDYLATDVVPAIVRAKPATAPIRVWSAGCATGEEAYSLAMVFAEHLGLDEFKARVKIYATDTDESALAQGRAGVYTARQLERVPADKLERYFEPTAGGSVFRPDYRRSVIFGGIDVTNDAPISRLDLLSCRNVLMYLTRETQHRVLSRFHYALGDGGYLFLGKAETIFAHADLFTAASTRFRVFTRLTGGPDRQKLLALTTTAKQPAPSASAVEQLRELAATATPVAQLVIDIEGTLVGANTRARVMFGLTSTDVGRPFRDLEVSFRPVELRSRIEQAHAESKPTVVRDVERRLVDGQLQFLEVTIAPLTDPAGVALGAGVTFADVTELGRMKANLERSARDLELANRSLHSANEELETSNEELQSTNEELETTNEELQSANEELETTNEELQSANEELETMNEELLEQARQIEESGLFLSRLLDSLTLGVVVVDQRLNVVVWNQAMDDMFGLRPEETVGRSLLALDIGVSIGDIGPLLHGAARTESPEPEELILDALNRRGQKFLCRVTVQRLTARDPTMQDLDHRLVVLMDPLPSTWS